MTSLDVWESFIRTHEERSVSAAARVLGLSQPAVSARLQRLEQEVGEPLFTRSRAGVVPTATADALAQRIGPLVDQLRQALLTSERSVRGRIRVGGAADVLSARVVPALAPLVRDGLDLVISTGLADDVLQELAAGALDLVVSSVRPTHPDLRASAFVDEEFVLVGSPSLAAQLDRDLLARAPVRALGRLPLVAFADDLPIIRRYWLTEFDERPTNRVSVVLPDLRGILRVVAAGAGVSVLPRYLVDPAVLDGTVVRLHESRFEPLNTLWLVTGPAPDEIVARVVAHLRSAAEDWSST